MLGAGGKTYAAEGHGDQHEVSLWLDNGLSGPYGVECQVPALAFRIDAIDLDPGRIHLEPVQPPAVAKRVEMERYTVIVVGQAIAVHTVCADDTCRVRTHENSVQVPRIEPEVDDGRFADQCAIDGCALDEPLDWHHLSCCRR